MDIRARNSHKASKVISYNSGIMGMVTKKSFQKRAACFTLLFMLFQIFSPVGTIITKTKARAAADIALGLTVSPPNSGTVVATNASDPSIIYDNSSNVATSADTIVLTATPSSGYTFDHWTDTTVLSGGGTGTACNSTSNPLQIDLSQYYGPDQGADLDCVANFVQSSPATYTVTFDSNGGSSVAALTGVASGATISAPTSPTRDGYTFDYWYKVNQDASTTQWNFSSATVTSDITLTAHWTANSTYTIAFDSNGGSSVTSITGIASGATITAPLPPTKTDYTFAGWYKESGLTNIWDFTSDTVTGDTTLYARWITTAGATFDIKTGTPSVTKSGATVNFGSTLPSNTGSGFDITVSPTTTSDNDAPDGKELVESYTITPSTTLTGTYTATITLTYPDGTDYKSGDTVEYWNGSAWATTGITVTTHTTNTITFTTNHFTEFAILSDTTADTSDTADKTSTKLPDAGASVTNIFVNMLLSIIVLSLLVLATKKTKFSFILS